MVYAKEKLHVLLKVFLLFTLYGENLRKIKVYYPSIEEQRKITSLLLLIDKRIAAQKQNH